jgi:hypothetical protein
MSTNPAFAAVRPAATPVCPQPAPARPRHLRWASTAALAVTSLGSFATEGGGNSYPMGVETQYNGLMLPEGLHPFVYYTHYEASHSKDDLGHDNARLAYFGLRSDAVALRLSWVWPGMRVFGANVETRVVQAVASVDLSLGIKRPAPALPLDRSGSRTGLADTAVTPVILGWHSPSYHQTLGIDSHLKTGTYDASQPVNIGRNHHQIAPFYALTWFPAPGWDVSAKFRYAFNSRNKATSYRSGDEASVEFGAGYRLSPALGVGVNGYLYRQTTDDEQNGVAVNGHGNRGRVNSLGPYLCFNPTPSWSLTAKLQSDFNVRNRPQGTRLWLQLRVPL